MDDVYEKHERDNGVVVKMIPDYDNEGPGEWDNLGTVYVADRRLCYRGWQMCNTDYHAMPVLIRANRIAGNPTLAIRVYDYGANGARVVECDDDEADGYIIATPESIAMTGYPSEGPEAGLRQDLEVWNMWLSGDVWGYVLETPSGVHLDSLWGNYGYDYAVEDADAAADNYTVEDVRAADLAEYTLERDAAQAKIDELNRCA